MTDLDALTAACLDDPDGEARLAVLGDWLEEHGDARADAVRRVLRWRAAVSAARPEEVPNDSEDLAAVGLRLPARPALAAREFRVLADWLENTAQALGPADARQWACACLRRLPLLQGGAGPALLADRRRRCVVAAAELFACGLLGADALRAACHEALPPAPPGAGRPCRASASGRRGRPAARPGRPRAALPDAGGPQSEETRRKISEGVRRLQPPAGWCGVVRRAWCGGRKSDNVVSGSTTVYNRWQGCRGADGAA
jgi:hypothetical protein